LTTQGVDPMDGAALYAQILKTSFYGATGTYKFKSNGDRDLSILVEYRPAMKLGTTSWSNDLVSMGVYSESDGYVQDAAFAQTLGTIPGDTFAPSAATGVRSTVIGTNITWNWVKPGKYGSDINLVSLTVEVTRDSASQALQTETIATDSESYSFIGEEESTYCVTVYAKSRGGTGAKSAASCVLVPKAESEFISGGLLALFIGILAVAWPALVAPQLYYIYTIGQTSMEMATRAAALELRPGIIVESSLDAVEMFVAVMIFTGFSADMTDVQKAEVFFVVVVLANVCLSAALLTNTLRQWREKDEAVSKGEEPTPSWTVQIFTFLLGRKLIEKFSREGWLYLEANCREMHSALSMVLLLPELICEVIIYADTQRGMDLICVVALSVDLGVRMNTGVNLSRIFAKPDEAWEVDINKELDSASVSDVPDFDNLVQAYSKLSSYEPLTQQDMRRRAASAAGIEPDCITPIDAKPSPGDTFSGCCTR